MHDIRYDKKFEKYLKANTTCTIITTLLCLIGIISTIILISNTENIVIKLLIGLVLAADIICSIYNIYILIVKLFAKILDPDTPVWFIDLVKVIITVSCFIIALLVLFI